MSNPNVSVSSLPIQLPADPLVDEHATTKHYVDTSISGKINRSGDTMTGPLILAGAPDSPNEATTKDYVDGLAYPDASGVPVTPTGDISSTNVQGAIQELDTEKVNKAGDTMTGPLILSTATPVAGLHAAPKSYVDKMGTLQVSVASGDFTWDSISRWVTSITHTLDRRPTVTIYDADGEAVLCDVVYNTVAVNGLDIKMLAAESVTVLLT